MNKRFIIIILFLFLLSGCNNEEAENEKMRNDQKEFIQQQTDALKQKIDSSKSKLDSAQKDFDNMKYRIKKDSVEIDSLMKKINPLKKIK
ncbi:MAG: lipoprotein [bacterium]